MVDPIDTKQTRKFFEETIELYPDAKDEPEYDAIFALCDEVDRLRAELDAELDAERGKRMNAEITYSLMIGGYEIQSTFYTQEEALEFAINHKAICEGCRPLIVTVNKITTLTETVFPPEEQP
jgi:hypothetical protein